MPVYAKHNNAAFVANDKEFAKKLKDKSLNASEKEELHSAAEKFKTNNIEKQQKKKVEDF